MKQQMEMQKRCVLLGSQGAGKTRLFNKICAQNEKSDKSMESNTKTIAQSQSIYGYGFHVQDTPGFGSYDEEVLSHSIGILAALTDGPVNRIILVVEQQSRIDVLKNEIDIIINIISEYKEIITIIITHKDQQDITKISYEEYFGKAQEMILQRYEVQSVFYSGYDTTGEELCYFIDSTLISQGQILEIQDSKFDQMMKDYIDYILKEAKEQFYNKFYEFYQAAKFFIYNFNSEIDNSQQILHTFICYVRNKSEQIQSNFEKEYGPLMEELNQNNTNPIKAYYYHLVLKHSIHEQVSELVQIANQKMKYPEDHPFRQLRRCTTCGTIWLKVAGCNGYTTCGNRTFKHQDDSILINQLLIIYQFKLEQNQLIYQTIIPNEPQYSESQVQFIQKVMEAIISSCPQLEGLRRSFNFDKAQDMIKFIQEVVQDTAIPGQSTQTILVKQQQNRFFLKANKELKRKLVEQNQKTQIINGGQIGCGYEINWENAPLVDINEIDVDQVQIFDNLSQNDLIHKEQFLIQKQNLVKMAQQEKKVLLQ